MNAKLLPMIGLNLLLTASLLYSDDMSAKDYADKFYGEWSAPKQRGDDNAGFMLAHFNHDVPLSLQAEVLDQILGRAISSRSRESDLATYEVLKYLTNFGSTLTLSPHFEANLNALTKSPNYGIRRDLLHVWGTLKRDKDHDLIVTALNDPNDEVRGAAIDALVERPGAEGIYQKFIQNHQSDPNYAKSIQYAKGALDEIHEGQKSNSK